MHVKMPLQEIMVESKTLGKLKHVVSALTKEEAIARVRKAHPKAKDVYFVGVVKRFRKA